MPVYDTSPNRNRSIQRRQAGPKPSGGAGEGGKVRLQRFMADAGVASRRDCEQMIEDGRVRVNGQVVSELPVFIDPREDRVIVDGRSIDARSARADRVYIILNKPDNTLSSTRDGGGGRDEDDDGMGGRDARRTVLDLVDHPAKARLFPVGRLDFHATGMVLLTNDGQLAQRLTHAKYAITKTYRITVRGRLHEEAAEALLRRFCPPPAAMPLDEDGNPTEALQIVSSNDSGTTFDLVMRAGAGAGAQAAPAPRARRQREREDPSGERSPFERGASLSATKALAGMLNKMGNPVKRIHRTAIGPLVMKYVAVGTWRALRAEEIDVLRAGAGLAEGRPRPRPRRPKPSGDRSGSRSGSRTGQRTEARTGPRANYRTTSRTSSQTGSRTSSRTGPRSDGHSQGRPTAAGSTAASRPTSRPGKPGGGKPVQAKPGKPGSSRSAPKRFGAPPRNPRGGKPNNNQRSRRG